MCSHCECKKKCHKSVTKYVKGGLEHPGNGSKKCPWNSLALAQDDDSWDKLVVLYSETPLNGGITLRPGTCLIGKPECGYKPVITNWDESYVTGEFPDAAHNFGNGAYVQYGDVKIIDIHFDNTWASGVNYDNANDILVAHCLITGFDQGALTLPPPAQDFLNTELMIGGLNGVTTNDGHSVFFDVEISDNYSGYGISEIVSEGADRKICIKECDIHTLITNNESPDEPEPPVFNNVVGIHTRSLGENTRVKLRIQNTKIHNFSGESGFDYNHTNGLYARASQGGDFDIKVKNSSFVDLTEQEPENLKLYCVTDVAQVAPGVRSSMNFSCKKSKFLYSVPFSTGAGYPRIATSVTRASDANYKYKKNIGENLNAAFGFVENETTLDKHTLIKNNVSCRTFVIVLPQSEGAVTTILAKQNNTFPNPVFGSLATFLIVLNGFFRSPLAELTINLLKNCFNEPGLPFLFQRFFSSMDFPGVVRVNGSLNNFLDTSFSLNEYNGDIVLNLPDNYWLPSPPTFIDFDDVTVDPELEEPIECYEPKNCKCH